MRLKEVTSLLVTKSPVTGNWRLVTGNWQLVTLVVGVK